MTQESARAQELLLLSRRLFAAACAAFALFQLYTAAAGPFTPLIQRGIFIGVATMLALWSIANTTKPVATARRWVFLVLAVAGLAGGVHAAVAENRFMDVMNDLTRFDMVVAWVAMGVIMIATQRLLGWSLPVMTVIGLVYYLWGNGLISGTWQPPRTSMDTVLSTLYASTGGLFGYMADAGTSVIAIYVIYGALLMATGASEVFVQLAARIAGRGHGGAAKVAVVTSALFGTVSGSSVANVMAVGTLTIPAMNRAGYPKAFAAGVEASASAGGQIMPPIMGAGAFLMAELLNIPYLDVALAAVLPAVLYFSVIFISVDLYARKHNLARKAEPKARVDEAKAVPLGLSVGTLIWALVDGYTATMSAAFATAVLLLSVAAFRLIRGARAGQLPDAVDGLARSIWKGLIDGGEGLIMIAVLLGCAGLLTAVLSASGLGAKVSSEMIELTGQGLLAALVMAALLCILLGMDLPTTASYVLTASVAAPLLTKLGLPPLAAHLFIFYFAILSAITPPVCSSVFAAAAIAQQDFWKVANYAMMIAAVVYFIPFMLVYRPALLLPAPPLDVAYALVATFLAMLAACAGMIGYLGGAAAWPVRIVLFMAALLFFIPGWTSEGLGATLLIAAYAFQRLAARRQAPAPAASDKAK